MAYAIDDEDEAFSHLLSDFDDSPPSLKLSNGGAGPPPPPRRRESIEMQPLSSPHRLDRGGSDEEEDEHDRDSSSSAAPTHLPHQGELKRTLGLFGGMGLIVGTMIGSGIFASPGTVLLQAETPGMSLVAWFFGGVIALMGALSYAELGTVIPSSGGEYAYFLSVYGPLTAFLYSWSGCLVTRPGSISIICLVFGQYLLTPFYEDETSVPVWIVKTVAIGAVSLITFINCVNVSLANKVQIVFSVTKLLALLIVAIVGLVFLVKDVNSSGSPAEKNFHHPFNSTGSYSVQDFGLAVTGALWSYDGWNNLNVVVEELINPSKNLPRAIILGMPLVIVFYVFANVAYFAVLPVSSIANFEENKLIDGFATIFGEQAMGLAGKILLPLFIAISTFGSANGTAFTAGRLVYAAAKEGHLPMFLARVYGDEEPTPYYGLIFQGILAVLFLLPGDFVTLVNYYSIVAWFWYLMAALCVILLRCTRPAAPRPFKVFLGIPIVFALFCVYLIFSLFAYDPLPSLAVVGLVLTGAPAYYFRDTFKEYLPLPILRCCTEG